MDKYRHNSQVLHRWCGYLLVCVLILLGVSGRAGAQTGPAIVNHFAGVPTGACYPNYVAIDDTTGDFYNCFMGVWFKLGPGLMVFPRLDQVDNPTADKTFVMGGHKLFFTNAGEFNYSGGPVNISAAVNPSAQMTVEGDWDSTAGAVSGIVIDSIIDAFTGGNPFPSLIGIQQNYEDFGATGTVNLIQGFNSNALETGMSSAPVTNFYGYSQQATTYPLHAWAFYSGINIPVAPQIETWAFYGAGTAASHFGGTTDAPIFNATTGFQIAGIATLANVLRGNGTNFVGAALSCADLSDEGTGCTGASYPGLVAHDILSVSHGDTTAAAVTRGGLMVGKNVSPKWELLTIGGNGTCLTSDGTDAAWGSCAAGSGTTISVNGSALAATSGDLDDATPAAPANGFNVKWQKDALTPTNISAYLDAATLGTATFGSGSAITWTFNVGATDPVIDFTSGNIKYSGTTTYTYEGGATDPVWTPGNSIMNLSTGTLQQGGNAVATAANNLSFFAATTSAQLYGVLSDETGSASGTPLAVFNQTPTIATPSFTTGFTIGGAAAAGQHVCGDGTNFVSCTPAGAQVGSVFVSKTMTNIGNSYVDIYVAAFDAEDMMVINFTGVTSVRAVYMWDYVGTGTQQVRWADASNNTNVLIEAATITADADAVDTGWVSLPAAFVGATKTIEWQGKSTTAGDDPVAKGYVLFVR